MTVSRNSATMLRTVLSRSRIVAMIRGVIWALATWIATSSELKAKTMNDSTAPTKTWSTVWAVDGVTTQAHDQSNQASTCPKSRISTSEARQAPSGTIHIDARR